MVVEFPLGLVSITRQMPRPRQINKAIIRLNSHPSRKSLCFDSKLVVVVVVIGLMETRLKGGFPFIVEITRRQFFQ